MGYCQVRRLVPRGRKRDPAWLCLLDLSELLTPRKVVHKSHTSQGDINDTQINSQFADPIPVLRAKSANRSSRCGASRGLRALGARPRNETPSQNPGGEAGAVAPIPSRRHRKFPHVSLVLHTFQNHAGQCMNNIVLRDQRWAR